MRFTLRLAASAAAFLAVSAQAAPNLVTNGGFEQVAAGLAGKSFEFGASYNYPNGVVGWSSPNANAFNLYWDTPTSTTVSAETRFPGEAQTLTPAFGPTGTPSANGGNFVMLDGDTGYNGPLQQAISGLVVGRQYQLSFQWAAAQMSNRTGATTERLDVSFGGATYSTPTVSNPSQGFSGWLTSSHIFIASATSQVLSFLSVGTPSGLPPVALLDGVSVTDVPEPASLGLLGLGMIGAGLLRRRRVGG